MPFVPCPNVAEFVLHQTLDGQHVVNVFHIKNEEGWGAASLALMCETVKDWVVAQLRGISAPQLVYNSVSARDLTTEMGIVAESSFPPNTTGSATGIASPGNVALAVGHKTGFAGRSARGRTFIAGISESMTANADIGDTYRVAAQNIFNALITAVFNGGGVWGVLSRFSGYTQTAPKYKKVPTPRGVGLFLPIIVNIADSIVDSQRRRLPGRGN